MHTANHGTTDGRRLRPALAIAGAAALLLAGCASGAGADGGSGPGGEGSGGDAAPVELTGSWQLVQGADADGDFWPADVDRPVTIEFTDQGVTGSAACNTYGSLSKEGAEPLMTGDVSFAEIVSTRMGCEQPLMTVETRYLGALDAVDTAEADGETLLLTGPDVSLSFEPARMTTQDDTDGTGDGTEDVDRMDQ